MSVSRLLIARPLNARHLQPKPVSYPAKSSGPHNQYGGHDGSPVEVGRLIGNNDRMTKVDKVENRHESYAGQLETRIADDSIVGFSILRIVIPWMNVTHIRNVSFIFVGSKGLPPPRRKGK